MLEFLFNCSILAVIGYVFTHHLITHGNVLSWYKQVIDKIPYEFIRKPLGECTVCFTGQIALWVGLFGHNMSICSLIAFICTSIFLVVIIENKI